MTEVVGIIFLPTILHATVKFVHLLSSFIHDLNYRVMDLLLLFSLLEAERPLQFILFTTFLFDYLGPIIQDSKVFSEDVTLCVSYCQKLNGKTVKRFE
jgi:hypothetical protein